MVSVRFGLGQWQTFYEIVGSAAGALTGLQFVVIALIAQLRAEGSNRAGVRAFGTPTVIHFCSALLIAALMSVPWPNVLALSICLGVGGLAGTGYSISIIGHTRKVEYKPDFEDRVWYSGLPLVAHSTLMAAAVLLLFSIAWTPFVVAADALLFLVLGIHNSWDTVTFIALRHVEKKTED